jgi:hypothetical protein
MKPVARQYIDCALQAFPLEDSNIRLNYVLWGIELFPEVIHQKIIITKM